MWFCKTNEFMSEDKVDFEEFVDSDGVYLKRRHDKPTFIKRVNDVVTEEHWFRGHKTAPTYADMTPDRLFNLRLKTHDSVTTIALTGSPRASRYAQPFDNPSVVRKDETNNEIVTHYFTGKLNSGVYKRNDGDIYTMSIRHKFAWYTLSVVGREQVCSVMIINQKPSLLCEAGAYYLFGDLRPKTSSGKRAHVCYAWLNALTYAPTRDGYVATFDHGSERIWAAGTWERAVIQRKDGLATMVSIKGKETWLDGLLEDGDLDAVYWRPGNLATVISARGTKHWKRGSYPEPHRDTDLLPYPHRITGITYPATYQLSGTCYLNAVINVLVCTPCFRNRIPLLLRSRTRPGVTFEQDIFTLFHDILCTERVPQRPVKQSNAVRRLELSIYGTNDEGGRTYLAAMVLCTSLGISWTLKNIRWGRLREQPEANKDLFLLVAKNFRHVPREVTDADGNRMTMVACAISYIVVGTDNRHAVCGLLDLTGNPHIILDSNGVIEDLPWWPEIKSKTRSNLVSVLIFYVSDAILHGRPTKCSASAPSIDTADSSDTVASTQAWIAAIVKIFDEIDY